MAGILGFLATYLVTVVLINDGLTLWIAAVPQVCGAALAGFLVRDWWVLPPLAASTILLADLLPLSENGDTERAPLFIQQAFVMPFLVAALILGRGIDRFLTARVE